MNTAKSALIKEYYHKVKHTNKELTKKEAFKDPLYRLYTDNKTKKNCNEKDYVQTGWKLDLVGD